MTFFESYTLNRPNKESLTTYFSFYSKPMKGDCLFGCWKSTEVYMNLFSFFTSYYS
jgi:hypothetical protein